MEDLKDTKPATNSRRGNIEENTNTRVTTRAEKPSSVEGVSSPKRVVYDSTAGSELQGTTDLDRGPEYIARLQAVLEETLSKPRKGTHVTDLVLCRRLRVFREIDPLPINAKTLAIFVTGMAIHGVYQWLLLRDNRRFEREKHLEFRGVMGSADIVDKIRNIPIEFKSTRASSILEAKSWHVQQLKYYMAMLGASQGYLMYQLLMHFGNTPFKTFKITMTAHERKELLDKLVEEADSLKRAMEARDPSLAKPVYDDPKLNWLCRDCPYQVNCKRIQEAAAAA